MPAARSREFGERPAGLSANPTARSGRAAPRPTRRGQPLERTTAIKRVHAAGHELGRQAAIAGLPLFRGRRVLTDSNHKASHRTPAEPPHGPAPLPCRSDILRDHERTAHSPQSLLVAGMERPRRLPPLRPRRTNSLPGRRPHGRSRGPDASLHRCPPRPRTGRSAAKSFVCEWGKPWAKQPLGGGFGGRALGQRSFLWRSEQKRTG